MKYNIEKLKNKIAPHKTLIQNFSYLSALQVFNMLIPLITYPFLIRVLGADTYGLVIFAQTIISYFSLVINFGFNVSGPKEVAIKSDSIESLSEYVSSIYIIKFSIWFLCLLIYLTLIYSIDFFHKHFIVYFFSFFVTIGDVLFPIWFFQGIEKMKYITYINLFVRSIFLLAIFIFIKHASDYFLIPVFNAIAALISGLIAVYFVFSKEKVVFIIVSRKKILHRLKEDFAFFVSTISIQLYVNLNKIIVGSYLSMSEVTIYDLAEKVTSLLKIPIGLFSQAVFPKISKEKSIRFINKIMYLVVIILFFIYGLLFFTSDLIVQLFIGSQVPHATNIIRILGVSIIFVALNIFLGSHRLIPFGFNKKFMNVALYNTLFYFFLIGFLFTVNFINIYTIAFAYLLVEIFCFYILLIINNKLGLLKVN